jgi:uncharacterized protein (DUF427 family)
MIEHATAVVEAMVNPMHLFKRPDLSAAWVAVAADTVVASATETQKVDGYDYFAPEDVNWDLLEPSSHTSVCPWKGVATYYDVVVDGTRFPAAAWTYRDPSDAAASIKGHVAFWRGVEIARG